MVTPQAAAIVSTTVVHDAIQRERNCTALIRDGRRNSWTYNTMYNALQLYNMLLFTRDWTLNRHRTTYKQYISDFQPGFRGT